MALTWRQFIDDVLHKDAEYIQAVEFAAYMYNAVRAAQNTAQRVRDEVGYLSPEAYELLMEIRHIEYKSTRRVSDRYDALSAKYDANNLD